MSKEKVNKKVYKSFFIRINFIIIGTLFFILAIVGAFLPVLPTVPFLLLSSFFYARSSDKLHKKLVENKYFGKHILNWEENKIIPLKIKIISIFTLNLSIILTCALSEINFYLKILLLLIDLIVCFYIISKKSKTED